MKAEEIVLLGVQRTVVAFEKATGEQLWTKALGSGSSFVSIVADSTQVYVHTKGEFICLDLGTGKVLWRDPLRGLGYGIASIAIPNGASTSVSSAQLVIQQEQANSTLDASSASG